MVDIKKGLKYISFFRLKGTKLYVPNQEIISTMLKKSTNHKMNPNNIRRELRIIPVISKSLPLLLYIPALILLKSIQPVIRDTIVRATPKETNTNRILDINPYSEITFTRELSKNNQARK